MKDEEKITPKEVVKILNNAILDIVDNGKDACYYFSYSTDGYIEIIHFENVVLWSSDNDERQFDEDKNEYEDLQSFIIKKYLTLVSKYKQIEKAIWR